jgi:hypothetical protein
LSESSVVVVADDEVEVVSSLILNDAAVSAIAALNKCPVELSC